jgi:S1-C subfamily serine protease
MDVPSGSIELTCRERPLVHSAAAGRVKAVPGRDTPLTLFVVVSNRPAERANGIGARWLFGFDEVNGGYTCTIAELRPGGAADQAGLRVGDVVLAIDGRDVRVLIDVDMLLGRRDLGTSVTATVARGGRRLTVSVAIEGAWR